MQYRDGKRTRVQGSPAGGMRFGRLSLDDERHVALVVELLHEAGNPYEDWFHGSPAAARAAIAHSLHRPTSELAAARVRLLLAGERALGVLVALPGSELQTCRKADALAAAADAGDGRPELVERMRAASGLFLPVAVDELYLSRMAVPRPVRGRGIGRHLLAEFVDGGREEGYTRFCLDVAASNEPAVQLYDSYGFCVEERREAAGMAYLRMALDDGP